MTDVIAAVEGEVAKVVEEVKAIEKRTRVEVEAVEKLVLRDSETEFLRAQLQARDLQTQLKDLAQKSEAASKKFGEDLEKLVQKYSIDKTEMIWNQLESAFVAIQKQPAVTL